MRIEECRVGMRVVINNKADGCFTRIYRGSSATIEKIYLNANKVDIYCEDKSKRGSGVHDGSIRGVLTSNIDRVAIYDSIECSVDEILL